MYYINWPNIINWKGHAWRRQKYRVSVYKLNVQIRSQMPFTKKGVTTQRVYKVQQRCRMILNLEKMRWADVKCDLFNVIDLVLNLMFCSPSGLSVKMIIHRVAFLSNVAWALSHWEWRTYFYLDTLDWSWALYLTWLPTDGNIAQNVALFIITLNVVRPHLDQGFSTNGSESFSFPNLWMFVHDACQTSDWDESELDR